MPPLTDVVFDLQLVYIPGLDDDDDEGGAPAPAPAEEEAPAPAEAEAEGAEGAPAEAEVPHLLVAVDIPPGWPRGAAAAACRCVGGLPLSASARIT